MKLDPADYICSDHHTDLTGQVLNALDEDVPPVAYRRPLLGRKSGPWPFEVRVTCPGDASGGPHQLTCAGTWTQ